MKNVYLLITFIIGTVSYFCFTNEVTVSKIVDYLLDAANRNILNYFTPSKVLSKVGPKQKLFTIEELSKYDGNNGKIYLSILGKVFDVTKGKKYYGPGENYHGFAGRDASKAFITGDFSVMGLTDDLSGLSLSDLSGLKDWLERYYRDYTFKGKLIGRFYANDGSSTSYLKEIELKFQEADKAQEQNENYNLKYPPCNIEWSQEAGSRVWCSNKSGGVTRNWIGVPRKVFLPGWNDYRCACIKVDRIQSVEGPKLEQYDNCNPLSESCYVPND